MDSSDKSAGEVDLSIVIPAYDEEAYLPATVAAARQYLEGCGRTYEILVVDDGSQDRTYTIAKGLAAEDPRIRALANGVNCGKGYTVRAGMRAARGKLKLFMDADGSTAISELPRLEEKIAAGYQVVIGSRALPSAETKIEARWYRVVMGRVFNFLVTVLIVPGLTDTQCGFKLFTREAAERIFALQTAERFSFDVELLLLARVLGFKIAEVPVNWRHMPGSSVHLVRDSLAMFCDLFRFRWYYLIGRYSRVDSE